MTAPNRIAAAAALLLAACATAGGAGTTQDGRYYQAGYRFPEPRQFPDDAERGEIQNIRTHMERGQVARESGNMDQARAEWASAAGAIDSFVARFPSVEWRLVLRYTAGRLYLFAEQPDKAAEQVEKILVDPQAKDESKALAAHMAAFAWLKTASAKAKAGQLEPVRLPTPDQRKGAPPAARVPPGEWKRFVDAADAYARVAAADPDAGKPPSERPVPLGAAEMALRAAQVEYAFDNFEDARGRLERVISQWPAEVEILEGAVPLYLYTFQIAKDQAGFAAAVATVKAKVAAPANADAKVKESYARVQAMVARLEAEAAFTNAQRLLDEGKIAEAAAAFEAIATRAPDAADAPNALFNAAVAFDKAGQGEKAAALRGQLLERYPESRVAPQAMLAQAAALSKAGKKEEAAALYGAFLQKYPENPNRCGALFNVGVAWDEARKPQEAAVRYLAYGTDKACAGADVNGSVRLLFRAGEIFEKARKKAQAREAYQAAAAMADVTDVVAKSQQVEARKRAKGL